jgi:hypothetical protein
VGSEASFGKTKLSASADDVNSRKRVSSRRLDILALQLKLGLDFEGLVKGRKEDGTAKFCKYRVWRRGASERCVTLPHSI